MKIVLDLQGAQSYSRHRGIGRYTLAMAKAFAVEASHHEVWLALNGRHAETCLSLMEQFDGLIPRARMAINELPAGIAGCDPHNRLRMQAAAVAQAGFFAGLQADCIWHSSFFEGWGDDSTIALGSYDRRRVATFYDLIPLLHPDRYLHDAAYRRWYYHRLGLLKRCGLLLALSESSRREAIDFLHVTDEQVDVVSGAADAIFRPALADAACWSRWHNAWRLQPGFVLYAGGYDRHKNVDALIAAYADLPVDMRRRHSLVLAGRCAEETIKKLRMLGRKCGLPAAQLVFTGSLEDDELARLYSSCHLFVAPSLHEGLGLPPLEAMACGAAVIGSNTASLPEVIGRSDALFDPRSRSSISAKLHGALTDKNFLAELRAHAAVQTRQFAWPVSARKALAAIERHAQGATAPRSRRPRLLYVSPLPPVRSGIADYSAHLLREMATHYDIEVVVDQAEVTDPWVQANFPIRSLHWFLQHAGSCERILYHMGNSPFHAHMFGMMKQWPGVVALHDSWLGAARNWMANDADQPQQFLHLLYDSHGYAGLLHDLRHRRPSTLDVWPVNRDVIEGAMGVIVHSNYAIHQARRLYGASATGKFVAVPFPKGKVRGDKREARGLLGIGPDDFVVCSFGMLAPTKLNHRLLDAWMQSPLSTDSHCHLVFVGENDGGDYGKVLVDKIRAQRGGGNIRITGFVSTGTYADYLNASDVAVQLRAHSRGETSAAIFDALAHGVALIANAHGSAAELPDTAVLHVADLFSDAELSFALQSLYEDGERRERLGTGGRHLLRESHHPAVVARRYRDAIEHFIEQSPVAEEQRLLTEALRRSAKFATGEVESDELRKIVAMNRPRTDRPRLYIDVTATAASKLHTGIERVVRGVLSALLHMDQSRYRIEPVRLENGRYVHATRYGMQVLGYPQIDLPQHEVTPCAGDVLLGLDWVADALPANTPLLDAWRARGVRMLFVVYDLLPVRSPYWFPEGIAAMHARWLQCIGRYADGLLCISRYVAEDLRRWFVEHPPERRENLALGYFYPGNDPAATHPSMGLPADAAQLIAQLRASPSFLMVGTVEPRKGHAFVLDVFERMWAQDLKASLVVVGRQGWMSEEIAARMRSHIQAGAQLHWLEHVSDEFLEHIYDSVRALVAASEAEGFGLPLVEAARRGLPVIARDIPVFREVSSSFATYFDGNDPCSLIAALQDALDADRDDRALSPEAVPSWTETTTKLWEMLFEPGHVQWLDPWNRA